MHTSERFRLLRHLPALAYEDATPFLMHLAPNAQQWQSGRCSRPQHRA